MPAADPIGNDKVAIAQRARSGPSGTVVVDPSIARISRLHDPLWIDHIVVQGELDIRIVLERCRRRTRGLHDRSWHRSWRRNRSLVCFAARSVDSGATSTRKRSYNRGVADIYYVRIGSVYERHVRLHCLSGFTNDGTNYASSRSFALSVLLDAKDHADDYTYLSAGAPERVRCELMRLAKCAASAASPLHDALSAPVPWEMGWHQTNVPRFIASTTLVARHNVRLDPAVQDEVFKAEERGMWHLLTEAWERLHHFDLDVVLTDAKYCSHLMENLLFGTAAFDAWIEEAAEQQRA